MTHPSTSAADLDLGYKVIDYAFKALAVGVTIAVTWSCSSIVMGIIMFIITALVMALLCAIASIYVMVKLPDTTVAGIGNFVGGAAARVTGLFTRKVAA